MWNVVKPAMKFAARKAMPALPALALARGTKRKKRVAKAMGKTFLKNTGQKLAMRLAKINLK